MKIQIDVAPYGGSTKAMVTITSEKNKKRSVTLSTYYYKDVETMKELVDELEAERKKKQ